MVDRTKVLLCCALVDDTPSANDRQGVDSRSQLDTRVFKSIETFLIFLAAHVLLVVKPLAALIFAGGEIKIPTGDLHSVFSGRQLALVGNHLDAGYHIAGLDLVAGLYIDFSYDTRNLRLDLDLVARLLILPVSNELRSISLTEGLTIE